MSGRLCSSCGRFTTLPGGRCARHRTSSNRSRHNALYSSREWIAISGQVLAAHRGQYGDVCPGDGDEHPAHPTSDLTVDHRLALTDGGAALDRANLRVLCRSWNSRLGAIAGNRQRSARRAEMAR